jgi:hypothetical protein
MPVSRSHLTRPKPRQVAIDLGEGDTINVVFDTNKITPAWMRDAQERDNEQDSLSLPKALSDVIISWDVTEDDGSSFAPSAENIAVLSYPAQSELLTRILTTAVPTRAEGEVSSELSSSPAATSSEPVPALQNGPQPSPLPAPSASPSPT